MGSSFTSSNAVEGKIEFHGLSCRAKNAFVPYAEMTPEELGDVLRDGEKWIKYDRRSDQISLREFVETTDWSSFIRTREARGINCQGLRNNFLRYMAELVKAVEPDPSLPDDTEVPF